MCESSDVCHNNFWMNRAINGTSFIFVYDVSQKTLHTHSFFLRHTHSGCAAATKRRRGTGCLIKCRSLSVKEPLILGLYCENDLQTCIISHFGSFLDLRCAVLQHLRRSLYVGCLTCVVNAFWMTQVVNGTSCRRCYIHTLSFSDTHTLLKTFICGSSDLCGKQLLNDLSRKCNF